MNTNTHYDVVVVGGGTAGVVAAVQAARAGAHTLLVEKNGTLGGTITTAGVNFPGLFHAWGRQIIAGIGWELVTACVSETGGTLPDFTDLSGPHWKHQVKLDRSIYAALCDEAVINANADLLLHTMIADAKHTAAGWQVRLCTKTGLKNVSANVLIDCTADANLTTIAGGQTQIHKPCQPATLVCKASGYDVRQLDIEQINRHFESEVKKGRLACTDAGWNTQLADVGTWLNTYGVNANHIAAGDAHRSEGKTTLEIDARRSFLRLYRFLKQQPGLENLHIDHLAAECGVRETVTIVGEATVTGEDYVSGKFWDDAVCYSFYPIDLHTTDGKGLDCRKLPEGVVPTVPRNALLVKDTPNLIAAGRCISSDRPANSALRVQATCMATGQAAGALAALAANDKTDVRSIGHAKLCRLLKEHDAIIPAR